MSVNLIIKSIINYTNDTVELQGDSADYNNRIQNMGSGFENYVKELFLDTTNYTSQQKTKKFAEIFSWQGSANNPPDLILKNSFAIEVKNRKSRKGGLILNYSYPKNSISSDYSKLSKDCSKIDGGKWKKYFFYYIGEVCNKKVNSLFIIDGKCYSADKEIYERIFDAIKDGISNISDVNFSETKELGKVKDIDPYKITDLRVRGMWNIQTPPTYLGNYIDDFPQEYKLLCIIEQEKYDSVDNDLKQELEDISNVAVTNLQLPDPNNLSKLKNIVMIKVV